MVIKKEKKKNDELFDSELSVFFEVKLGRNNSFEKK